ncbi:MAG TPA: anhydro-N-acetylmuramic acid kinase [Actinopolymorphaceae bacterium]
MRVVGIMSGTSYDGIDVAVADLSFEPSGAIGLDPVGAAEYPHTAQVRDLIAHVLPPAEVTMQQVCELDTLLGQAFADAAARGIEELAGGRADLIVCHGQTVFHWIEDGRARGTLQLGQPAWIAERTGVPVVSDLRARDITKGGQGAPLVPIFDVLLLPPTTTARAVLNLGGIANMTVIAPNGDAVAYDLGPANALLDAAAERFLDEPYDRDGAHAASGKINAELLGSLLAEPYYRREPPKSTGKELFNASYLAEQLAPFPDLPSSDILATLTELTARVIVTEIDRHDVSEVVASGGGVRNPLLMRRVRELASPGLTVRSIDDFGIPSGAKEAYAFAVLGYLTVHGVPATIPSCTGATAPALLGGLTPGAGPLRLPDPRGGTPAALLVRTREDRGHDRSDDRSGDGENTVARPDHRRRPGHP